MEDLRPGNGTNGECNLRVLRREGGRQLGRSQGGLGVAVGGADPDCVLDRRPELVWGLQAGADPVPRTPTDSRSSCGSSPTPAQEEDSQPGGPGLRGRMGVKAARMFRAELPDFLPTQGAPAVGLMGEGLGGQGSLQTPGKEGFQAASSHEHFTCL